MTQIKSEKAKAFLKDKKARGEIFSGTYAIQRVVGYNNAHKAVKIAETEAEQRHSKELQELKDRAIKAFCVTNCGNVEFCYSIFKLTCDIVGAK